MKEKLSGRHGNNSLLNIMFNNIYKKKRVLITGHTGFKGSWLSLWLFRLGAEVIGYSIDIPTSPNHFEQLKLNITSIIGKIHLLLLATPNNFSAM